MSAPPAPTAAQMPMCPKCATTAQVIYIGQATAFQGKGKPPVRVYGCLRCREEFVPRTMHDHPAFLSDGIPPARSL